MRCCWHDHSYAIHSRCIVAGTMTTITFVSRAILWIAIGYVLGMVVHSQFDSFADARLSLSSLARERPQTAESGVTVEDLMYKYKSDKSRDDHGYTKLYHMLFANNRLSVKNFTEIGLAFGQSIQAWYRYFPNAEIHAFDDKLHLGSVKNNMEALKPRVHTHIVDILDDSKVGKMTDIGFVPESMDVIIEDGPHTAVSQELFLHKLWPLVKPGGYYIIEDIGYKGIRNNGNALALFYHDNTKLMKETRDILEAHDTIFVSTAIGQRSWFDYLKRTSPIWAIDQSHHNSHLVVIQKRVKPLPPMEIFVNSKAMSETGVIKEESTGKANLRG